uniref:Uncharacterized protein n=1 Tax=Arundo donax TaxID=35708 RepID=A0A0A9DUN3_ARUDO
MYCQHSLLTTSIPCQHSLQKNQHQQIKNHCLLTSIPSISFPNNQTLMKKK